MRGARALCAQAGAEPAREPANSISVSIENRVATVRFNNVDKRNALNVRGLALQCAVHCTKIRVLICMRAGFAG